MADSVDVAVVVDAEASHHVVDIVEVMLQEGAVLLHTKL